MKTPRPGTRRPPTTSTSRTRSSGEGPSTSSGNSTTSATSTPSGSTRSGRISSGVRGVLATILLDRRGTGQSSRNVPPSDLETRASDLLAVLDALDPTRRGRWPPSGGAASALFAATGRTGALVGVGVPGSPFAVGARLPVGREHRVRRTRPACDRGALGNGCPLRGRLGAGRRHRTDGGDVGMGKLSRQPARPTSPSRWIASGTRPTSAVCFPPCACPHSSWNMTRAIGARSTTSRRSCRTPRSFGSPATVRTGVHRSDPRSDPHVPRVGGCSIRRRPGPGHRAVHRHRRLDQRAAEIGDKEWKRLLAEHHTGRGRKSPAIAAARSTRPETASSPRSRSRTGRAMRAGDPGIGARDRDRGPGGGPHWRGGARR